jgi:hypothetical protein
MGWRGFTWVSGRPYATTFSTYSRPNPPYSDWGAINGYGFFAARSYHSGGVLVTLGDGSVKFVTNNVNLLIWQHYGKIHSGVSKGDLN